MHVSLLPKPLFAANTVYPLNRKMFARNWPVQPPFFNRIPNIHRIVLDCYGFSPKTIHTEVRGNQLVVVGNEGNKTSDNEDYSIRQFRKTLQLPTNLDTDKLTSVMTANGRLVIDIPFKKSANVRAIENDSFPKISEDKKSVSMNIAMPKSINPSKLEVRTKDGKLIVKYQDKKEEKTDHGYSKAAVSFYRKILLPKNTDVNALTHKLENNQLSITAPLVEEK